MARIRRTTVLLAIAAALACSVAPVQAENVLRWATPTPAETFDPHRHDILFTYWVQRPVYEALIDYDRDGRIEPKLATSWKRLAPRTWELKLRRGVLFHDGTPLTSADVVFSIERAKAETSSVGVELTGITKIEASDADTLRFTAATSNPIVWDDLTSVAIMSKAWAERHGAELPSQLGDDRWDYVEAHANGTGPFMLSEFEPGKRTVLVRNPDWWGLGEHPHNLDRIVQTKVADPHLGARALIAGELDLLQSAPGDQLGQIAATPGLKVQKVESSQTIYFGFDQASPELRTSSVKGRNPFADRRVRQAVYQAIDMRRILEALDGLAVPAGMLIWSKGNGWSEELDRRLPYDPATAEALLAEAGFPQGFDITLACSTVRELDCSAARASLQEIGITANIALQPSSELGHKIQTHVTDLFQWGYTEPFDSIWVFKDRYRSDADFAGTGYANPEVDALIGQAEGEMVTYIRDGLIEKIWRKILDDIVYVPLYHPINAWAMRANLELPISIMSGGMPEFRDARYTSPAVQ